MEATEVGLTGLSCGFKFEPSDEDLVLHFLLPHVRGHLLPFEGAIIYDDPRSAPPWELLARHGKKEEAFFFAPSAAKYHSGNRRERGCVGGGMWKGQKGIDDWKKSVGGELIQWRKYVLSYHLASDATSTGWVMHEYELTSPKCPQLLLCRVRISEQGKKRKRLKEEGDTAVDNQTMPPRTMLKSDPSVLTRMATLEAPYYSAAVDEPVSAVEMTVKAERSHRPEQGQQPPANAEADTAYSYDCSAFAPTLEDQLSAEEKADWLKEMLEHPEDFAVPDPFDIADLSNNDAMKSEIENMGESSYYGAFNGEIGNVGEFSNYGAVNGEIGDMGEVSYYYAVNGEVGNTNMGDFGNYVAMNGQIGDMGEVGNYTALLKCEIGNSE